ncbi:MAG TPA: alpha/beta hydrolase [Myxococcota bacterium]|jgi:4,5:9,10-diseco-3-hydroxy-5,9,17-trioxoandrosta-1(10),2-diene-4-oate hydrolase|nr:alpha/beta hydrolase [Myxococcota bacterium]
MTTLPEFPAADAECEIDGVKLAWREAGSGPPLVCLHAVGHDARDFSDLAARFASRRRVIALDWPGHGRSSTDPRPTSAARYADLAGRWLEVLALRHVVLLGNSIGGAAALRLALAAPTRIRGLVLCDPGGLDRVDLAARLATRAMARFFDAGARGARWFPRAFAAYYRLVLPAPSAAVRRAEIVADATRSAPILAAAWRSFGEPEADQRSLAPQVGCPVLVAWASRDRFIQLRRSRPAIACFRDARLVTFDGGHAPFLEAPDAFAGTLGRFLDEVEGTG